ncbi:MAG: hypothetical protein A3A80_03390 [Candidatus Terrybacteria bacterium RIFCSPLOWO2_01_FULL_44_24]|uniref:Polyketide cyclase n=1 Tax=Candidatus Terrybacteria bacterium RIFCSPHIGHO2_01_FULL_43_35 TaxID=1802361 RepID=A0A1G2PF60_9BACT|nr:MAG: hypothetical protein A2828_00305 [Candidatus Terrybacteria bacterium RIFCSPHIGHO2_01_FULL_43_35]OHA49730.1 MAG: hypothetical protein A3B75_01880 [Candidatus Terrybacteria bacterium RIFCSPHIGHO2_02_FULL_43_14]OHA51553.1 MAG: hypothetical protein A3A80_03390 [Candidatus Terrybacteria bacterium RIFCSPLOWO2_01_FULL_44_24]
MRHYQYEESVVIPASPEDTFAYVDNHTRFSSHMTKSSWMMGGGRMNVSVDAGRGQEVGSHIRLSGKAFGIPLSLDEVVIRHESPRVKVWETVGIPKLIVVGHYQMKIEVSPQDGKSLLRVAINYELPKTSAWLGRLFGRTYAKWCVRQMIKDARDQSFARQI